MQYFTRLSRLLLAGVGLTLALPAFAAGTDAGLLVTNSVTLDYQVNGGDQPQQTDSIDFTVDLRLDVLVGAVDADWISATIGQEVTGVPPLTGVPALNFLVTNNSNADVDVVLGVVERGAVDITGFTNDPGATSTGVDSVIVAIDDGSATYEEGVDTVLTPTAGVYSLPATLAQDDSVTILVVADIAAGAANGDYEAFSLVAGAASAPGVAYERDESGGTAPGSTLPAQNLANVIDGPAQAVFADFQATFDPENFGFNFVLGSSSGAVDALYDGQSSDTSGYVITGVDVLVAKYAEVIFDPVSGNKYTGGAPNGAEPKAIPGAVIMYVVGVTNQDTAFSADNINVVDDIPDGAGPVELVDEGNLSGSPIDLPTLVTVDFDTNNPGTITEDFGLGVVTDQSVITSSSCAAVPVVSTVAFDAALGTDPTTNPEVVVDLGTCDADSEGFIVYFVTVETNG